MDLCPAWKVKTIDQREFCTALDRVAALKRANFNVAFRRQIRAKEIFVCMSDGTNCGLSTKQMGALYDGDEAYAGAKDFYNLGHAVSDIFGFQMTVPAHNAEGVYHIFNDIAVKTGSLVIANNTNLVNSWHIQNRVLPKKHLVEQHSNFFRCSAKGEKVFHGNFDIDQLSAKLKEEKDIAYVLVHLNSMIPEIGEAPMSVENLRKVSAMCKEHSVPVVIETTYSVGNAVYVKENEDEFKDVSIREIIRTMCDLADGMLLSTGEEFLSTIGGVISFHDSGLAVERGWFRLTQSKLVEFEGLHTYGGISGRDMGVMAVGIQEATAPTHVIQRVAQVRYLAKKLEENGVKGVVCGTYSVLIDVTDVVEGDNQAFAVAAALFAASGILANTVDNSNFVMLHVPARTYTRNHLDYVATAFGKVVKEAPLIPRLYLQEDAMAPLLRVFSPNVEGMYVRFSEKTNLAEDARKAEPWEIRVVEFIAEKTEEERMESLKVAGFNTFLLRMDDGIKIDILTDSGTNAMSVTQWGRINEASESGGDWHGELCKAVYDVYSFEDVLPTHQGRMAEFLISQCLIREGDVIPGNMYFTTTKHHQIHAGATFIDVIIPEAHESMNYHLFKGDVDVEKVRNIIESRIKELGSPRMPYISVAGPVNMAGGEPFSMENLKQLRTLVDIYNDRFPDDPILLVFDMTRGLENAEMIREMEEGYANLPVGEVLKMMSSYFDAATMSSKKDHLVNIGGFLAIRKTRFTKGLYEKAHQMSLMYDGMNGMCGLAQRNLAALATGVREQIDEGYIHSRLMQVRKFGEALQAEGVPIVVPIGGHAVYIDANQFCSHLSKEQFRAQTLAAEIFKVSGLRCMERGAVSAGRDYEGNNIYPPLELIRLTIPRRVYLDEVFENAAKEIGALFRKKDSIRGLKMVYEPKSLRFFQARFEQI